MVVLACFGRFHLLSEFDEGKRSCRKRLADHNRRRRKPQPIASSGGGTTAESVALKSEEHDFIFLSSVKAWRGVSYLSFGWHYLMLNISVAG